MSRVCYVSRIANDADVDTVGEQILLVRGSSRKKTLPPAGSHEQSRRCTRESVESEKL